MQKIFVYNFITFTQQKIKKNQTNPQSDEIIYI
jgi:hypothetical protein